MRGKEPVASPPHARTWTRPDDYIEAFARKRSFRRSRAPRERTQPEEPRMSLSTVPFLVLMAFLAVLGIGIIITAIPGSQSTSPPKPVAKEQGVAERGWFQEAQKEMHH